MPKYIFNYYDGGMPESEEEQAEHMAAWGEWMGANNFVDMGAPVAMSMKVTADGSSPLEGASGGYGIVEAPDMAAACEIAKGCPVITLSGGSVQVGETFDIPGM